MASKADAPNFDVALGCLASPALDELATQLSQVTWITPREREIILAATRETLYAVLHAKLSRLLVLELNSARVTGHLTGENGTQRWAQFLELSSRRSFWDSLAVHYPSLLPRVERIVRNRCAAALMFTQRWASDRTSLDPLCGNPPGELQELSFSAGDSHHCGQTVALLRCEGGQIAYKPRSVAVDAALYRFINELAEDHGSPLTIRVPRVVGYQDHGWAEFIEHRYASGSTELRSFYQGIGHWLAVMRLLGGSDLHAENLIAQGGSPVVVDCETLFTPKIPPAPSELGQAFDHAAELVAGTVLSVGMLPGRGMALGWRGIDSSAVGMLPGQQPMLPQPSILKAGSDEAHIGTAMVEAPISQNHPSPQPALAHYWPEVLNAFDEMTTTLRRLDATGGLRIQLEAFANCRVRFVPRATEIYAELARMLWHPVSLHNEKSARQRAYDLLAKMAANVSSAPNDPTVINAEIDDLAAGDVPVFTTLVCHGQLDGPNGTHWLSPCNLMEAAWQHWRAANLKLERDVIRASLVSAYINDGWTPDEVSLLPERARVGDLDARRRRQAARIVQELVASAIRGQDGSVAWIAPVLGATGWTVQSLGQDLYGGISGVALLVGAYLRETAVGRADPVEGLEDLLAITLHTLELADAKRESQRKTSVKVRPPTPGGYLGLGSQIWARLMLAQWGIDSNEGLERTRALTSDIPEAVAADDVHDLLAGKAGAIPPLLALANRTGEERYLSMACEIGDQLCGRAQRKNNQAFWATSRWPNGLGGFAHGATGIAWALTKLARETGNSRYMQTAQAAFAFEETLFDADEQNWLDLRVGEPKTTAAAWCHGSVGIGLAHADIDPRFENSQTRQLLRRAAAATWRLGLGWSHCLCHGDMGAWELLDRAIAAGEGPDGLSRDNLLELILTSLENHGPVCGLARDAYAPGLMSGAGGIAYQLLRAHPDSTLPSILTLGGGGS